VRSNAQVPALLALDDGALFHGQSIGIEGQAQGEVVFNTAMTGYQEILTDPSYSRQLVTLTYPHIGNTGTNDADTESSSTHAAGLIVRDVPRRHSSWRATESLPDYLQRHGVVAIADIDTRQLTRHLREHGARGGCLITGHSIDAQKAVQLAQAFPGLSGMDLASTVTRNSNGHWSERSWTLDAKSANESSNASRAENKNDFHVVAMDFGVKSNILRLLVDRNCRVSVVPARTTAEEILAMSPDGVFLSNGPGDPEPCDYAIATIQRLLNADTAKQSVPLFGICLGHQLLALASGAQTIKMKFGHHGANHPVQDLGSGRVMISSQNHGFAVDSDTLGDQLEMTHVSLFDGTCQGLRRKDVPAFSFQGHPEASPGPHDVVALFDDFIAMMAKNRGCA